MDVSHEKKKKIKDDIEKIKRKKHLIEIYNIINEDENTNKTENNNGIFFTFNNLHNSTYLKLENYLTEINKNNNKNTSKFSQTISESTSSDMKKIMLKSNIRLSNLEKNIIKRSKYEQIINNNKDIIYESFGN